MATAAIVLLLRRREQLKKRLESIERPLRRKCNWEHLSDAEFIRSFRLDKATFVFLCDALRKKLGRSITGFPVESQVLSTLKLLGSGSFQNKIANDFVTSCSQSSISRNFNDVCDAIRDELCHLLFFPRKAEELDKAKKGFKMLSPFPNVVGILNCTHIAIQKPPAGEPHVFRNRKGTLSLNIQIVCDSDLRIIDMVARWPGSIDDAEIFSLSGLKSLLSSTEFFKDNFLLGHSKYPLEPWLMIPFENPRTPAEVNYNKAHCSAWSVTKKCIGLLKSRFRCLHRRGGPLCYSPKKVCKMVFAAGILHNLCVSRGVPIEEILEDEEDDGPIKIIIEEDEDDYDSSIYSTDELYNEGAAIRKTIAHELYEGDYDSSTSSTDELYNEGAAIRDTIAHELFKAHTVNSM